MGRLSIDSLWSHTQIPALHERWDLRFSGIEYLSLIAERAVRFELSRLDLHFVESACSAATPITMSTA